MQNTKHAILTEIAPAATLLIASVVAGFTATMLPSKTSRELAVVAPPWYNLGKTAGLIHRAGGFIDGVGGSGNVVIVRSTDAKLVSALYHAGAWLVVDPTMGRWGCGVAGPDAVPAAGRV